MNHSNCEHCRKTNCVSNSHELKGNQLTIIESCSQCHGITTTKYTVEVTFKQTVYDEPKDFSKVRPGISDDHHIPNEIH